MSEQLTKQMNSLPCPFAPGHQLLARKPTVGPHQQCAHSASGGIAIQRLMVDLFLDAHKRAPNEIVLDLDATDDLHGEQEGRFFHGYDCTAIFPTTTSRPSTGANPNKSALQSVGIGALLKSAEIVAAQ